VRGRVVPLRFEGFPEGRPVQVKLIIPVAEFFNKRIVVVEHVGILVIPQTCIRAAVMADQRRRGSQFHHAGLSQENEVLGSGRELPDIAAGAGSTPPYLAFRSRVLELSQVILAWKAERSHHFPVGRAVPYIASSSPASLSKAGCRQDAANRYNDSTTK